MNLLVFLCLRKVGKQQLERFLHLGMLVRHRLSIAVLLDAVQLALNIAEDPLEFDIVAQRVCASTRVALLAGLGRVAGQLQEGAVEHGYRKLEEIRHCARHALQVGEGTIGPPEIVTATDFIALCMNAKCLEAGRIQIAVVKDIVVDKLFDERLEAMLARWTTC